MKIMDFSEIRQFIFPREFRIVAWPWPDNLEHLLINDKSEEQIFEDHELNYLANICTGIWRLKQKFEKLESIPDEQKKIISHYFESIWDNLEKLDVKIQDHTNDDFDSGMSLRVLLFENRDNLEREKIIETIKPSIYFKDKRIQMGEVIVGKPRA